MTSFVKEYLSPRYLRAIGLVTAEWQHAEAAIESLIWTLAELDNKAGYAVTTHLTADVKLNMLSALANEMLADTEREQVISLVGAMKQLKDSRNGIVHAMWLPSKNKANPATKNRTRGTPKAAKVRANKGKVSITVKAVPVTEIEALAEGIAKVASEAFMLSGWIEAKPNSRMK